MQCMTVQRSKQGQRACTCERHRLSHFVTYRGRHDGSLHLQVLATYLHLFSSLGTALHYDRLDFADIYISVNMQVQMSRCIPMESGLLSCETDTDSQTEHTHDVPLARRFITGVYTMHCDAQTALRCLKRRYTWIPLAALPALSTHLQTPLTVLEYLAMFHIS